MYEQIDIFSLASMSKREELSLKLEHYKVDERIKRKFTGQTPLISTLREYAESSERYDEYYKELINELKKIVPVVSQQDWINGLDYSCLIESDDKWRYYIHFDSSKSRIVGRYGTLNYLGDLEEDFFIESK